MKLKLILFGLIPGLFMVIGCANFGKQHTFNAKKFHMEEGDKHFQLDSFKVINVVDNRREKGNVIGDATQSSLLYINRPLDDFLHEAFYKLICKDTTVTTFTPVTVYINQFYASRYSGFLRDCLINQYTYLFEYPIDSGNKRQILVQDSINYCNDPTVSAEKMIIAEDIREAARLFVAKVKEYKETGEIALTSQNIPGNVTDTPSTAKFIPDNTYLDTIDLRPIRQLNSKLGLMFNNTFGVQSKYGIDCSFMEIFHKRQSSLEFGTGLGLIYHKFDRSDANSDFSAIYWQILYRYNMAENIDGLFFDITCGIVYRDEKKNANLSIPTWGLKSEQSFGTYIWGNFALKAGIYEQGYLSSTVLPYDYGVLLSLNILIDY